MRIAPPSFLRLQAAHYRGDHLTVLAEGDAVAYELKRDPAFEPDRDGWLAEVALMLGAAHAAYERLAVACTYLEFGLAMSEHLDRGGRDHGARAASGPSLRGLRIRGAKAPPVGLGSVGGGTSTDAGPFSSVSPTVATDPTTDLGMPERYPPTPAPTPPRSDLPDAGAVFPGARSPRPPRIVTGKLDTSATDWAELLLLELSILLGRFDDALARITPLLEPSRPTTTRFAATRAQASIAAARGDDETAHFLLNTATGLANRVPSKYRVALVEGDRAMVFAAQGRTREAVTIADRLLGKFVRPPVGPHQLWSNAEGAAIAFTVSRASANEGDSLTAQRLLLVGEQACEPLGSAFFAAHGALTRGVIQGLAGDHNGAESALTTALQTFNTYGYRPAAAMTLLEQGRLAHRRGLVQSARPLYERAIDELRDLGQPRELRFARQLVAALDDQRPPIVGPATPAARPFPRYPAHT